MFPHEQGGWYDSRSVFSGRFNLLPPRLPRLHSHPGSVRISDDQLEIDTRHDHNSLVSATTNPSSYHFLDDRPRGRSIEEEGMHQRAMLPSVASLMPPTRNVEEHGPRHESAFDTNGRQQLQHLSALPYERQRAQTLPPYSAPSVPLTTFMTTTSSAPLHREVASGLDAFADPQLTGVRSSRYGASPSNRWSPYASVSMSSGRNIVCEPFTIPWDDAENEGAQQNHRRRRTSPRRRLAASKARARALQLSMEGDHARILGRFESDQQGFRSGSTPALPQPPSSSFGFSLPMPLRPPSPIIVDESDSSPSNRSSRYLREMDRRTILARLDRGERQSALAKEFRVTRAAICNLNKHRDLVLSRPHEDPLAKHPKKARRKQEVEDDTKSEKAAPSRRDGSNRVSLLLSDGSPKSSECSRGTKVHLVALQPAERLIPLLLSNETSDAAFRRYCDRLMTLVVEEVLAWEHTKASDTTCGISIVPGGSPMLSVFQALVPEFPVGRIKLNLPQVGSPVAIATDLPTSIATHNVCLFCAFTDTAGGVRVAKSIRELLDRGAVEELLCLVTLAVSALTVGELQRAHPSLRIAAAHVECQEDVDAWLQPANGLENDQHNYENASKSTSRLQLLATRASEIY